MHNFCPGAKLIRQPKPEIFICPNCGEEVEIWTDEIKAVCPNCKTTVFKFQDMSCVEWCKMAKECIGEMAYEKYIQNRNVTIKQKLIQELKDFFGKDQKRIDHAMKVAEYAEEIIKHEKGDWHIVIPSAILHDVGIKIAEEKYGSSAGHLQEKEGPPVAKKILLKMGMNLDDINEICEIIGHHHTPGVINSINFKILYDSDWLVNLGDEVNIKDKEKLARIIEKNFLTATGKSMAKKIYLG